MAKTTETSSESRLRTDPDRTASEGKPDALADQDAAPETLRPAPPVLPSGVNPDVSGTLCVPPRPARNEARREASQPTRPASRSELLDGEELVAGDEIGSYVICEMIGRGGCGTVYSAEHRATGLKVAVKVLRPSLSGSPHQVRRFVQEARALKLVDHPGIVEVYDTGFLHDGRPYFVMELLEGRGLASLLGERGRFSPREALEVLTPVCEMLELSHRAGIVHRDIKASNIMITEAAGQRKVKLLDFGLAKLLDPEQSGSIQTSMGVVLGTLHSMAPEQIMGATVDGRTDIYALGALLHRLLTGRHPFEDVDGHKVARMHLHKPPPLPSQLAPVSPALDAVVRRALEKEPARRFQTAGDLLAALRDAVDVRVESQGDGEAIAIYVEGRLPAAGELDEVQFDELMQLLDAAEEKLVGAGFQILLETTNAILAARILAGSSIASPGRGTRRGSRHQVDDAARVATWIHRELAELGKKDSPLRVNICLHHDRVTLKRRGQQMVIAGGNLVDLGSWAPRHDLDGVCITQNDARDPGSYAYVAVVDS